VGRDPDPGLEWNVIQQNVESAISERIFANKSMIFDGLLPINDVHLSEDTRKLNCL
jgi:hypothetical protein